LTSHFASWGIELTSYLFPFLGIFKYAGYPLQVQCGQRVDDFHDPRPVQAGGYPV